MLVLSLFFNQRSGSGGGVTPGTTPLGIRDVRTFLLSEVRAGCCCCCADTVVRTEYGETSCGGGASSRELLRACGSRCNERRKPVCKNSRCVWEAVKFVSESDCSSECCERSCKFSKVFVVVQSTHRRRRIKYFRVEALSLLVVATTILLREVHKANQSRMYLMDIQHTI